MRAAFRALVGTPVRAGTPVTPDAQTARRWAGDELADPLYHQGRSLLSRFVAWIGSLFDGVTFVGLALPGGVVAAIVVVTVLLVAGVAFWVAGPVRLARRAGASTVVLDDDSRTAAELRATADGHAARGDWRAAVLDRFRAIVRALEERALLDDRPGRTAHEAAETAAARLPGRAADLRRAGRLFDDVCYGKRGVDAGSDSWLRELDATLRGTRPAPVPPRSLVDAP